MELALGMLVISRRLRVVSIALAFLAAGLDRASANMADVLPELSDLQRWSIFAHSVATDRNQLGGTTIIDGDVGVAGRGEISLQSSAVIQGDLYYRSNGNVRAGAGTTITGAEFNNQNALLDNDAAAAFAVGRHAAAMQPSFFAPTRLSLKNDQDFAVNGAAGDTVVLKIGNFKLAQNSTFTLEGTATTTFIINVSNKFSLSGNSQIVLSGGVQWNNVLFNVTGKDSAVSLSGNASLSGTLMANRRIVQMTGHSSVTGEIIANRVKLSSTSFNGSASVNHPPIVSP